MTSLARFALMFVVTSALALFVLVGASARTDAGVRYGGTLVVGLTTGEPDVLDPTLSRTFSAVEVYRSFCEKLYDFNAKSQVVPQLAAAMPVISKDKLHYMIPLRKGVTFNDGTPLNAEAVVTTLQRMISLPGSTRASDFSAVESVTASGPNAVVVHLGSRFTPLVANLATPDGVVLSPTQLAKLGTSFATNPVCVGPFMYDHRVAGDNVTVIKSPYYYNRGDVHFDKIVYRVLTDAAAAAAALKAGDIHALDSVSPTELPGVEDTSSLRVMRQNTLGFVSITINLGNKNGVGNLPYSNVGTPLASSAKLRQAFEEAIDRNTLGRVVFGGLVQPGCTPVSPAETEWFDASIRCTPYNPADARRLVVASGFSNPTVHLLTPNATDMLRLAQFIQAQEAAVGINVVIDSADNATVLSRAASGNFDAYLSNFGGSPDTDRNIFQFLATSGSRNHAGYSNPRLDLILANGRKATSVSALKTLYHAAQQIVLEDRPIIYLYHPIRVAAVSSNVTGVQFFSDIALRVAFAQLR
jgi:peptide/nickel transport system substrate-binding protein